LNYPHGVDPKPSRARTAYRRTCRVPDAASLNTPSAAAFTEADPLFASPPRRSEPQPRCRKRPRQTADHDIALPQRPSLPWKNQRL